MAILLCSGRDVTRFFGENALAPFSLPENFPLYSA